jgi:hypothetical protein
MTRSYLAKTPGWMRLLALVLGIALLLWLPIEDVSEQSVVLFAALVSAWLALRYCLTIQAGEIRYWLRHMLAGALAGLFVTPFALFLMALKTGLHGHNTPDFTLHQMQAVLYRTPIWVLVGLLLGLGVALLRLARSS